MKIAPVTVAVMVLLAGSAAAAPRNLSGFDRVSARAGTDVQITIGPSFSVDVSGRDADRIVTRVANGQLIIEPVRGWSWRGHRDAHVRVTMPTLTAVEASSGADVEATGVNSPRIALDSSSGADLTVRGSCGQFTADASSGADIRAQELRCEAGRVDVSSGASARVFAENTLDVDASSGGDVIAYGHAGFGNISMSSGGTLRRAH